MIRQVTGTIGWTQVYERLCSQLHDFTDYCRVLDYCIGCDVLWSFVWVCLSMLPFLFVWDVLGVCLGLCRVRVGRRIGVDLLVLIGGVLFLYLYVLFYVTFLGRKSCFVWGYVCLL